MKGIFITLFFLSFFISSKSYMMGIDLGSEFFKVTVIKPGKPFMMMENLQSKTKTETAVGLKENEISYTYEALGKKARSPGNIFNFFSEYLGRKYDDNFVKQYMEDFFISYKITYDNITDSIAFNFNFNNKEEQLSITELYAMLFNHIKFLSERFTKIEMTTAYITIPSSFDYLQRQAISEAISISELTLGGIVSENLAAAVQYQLKKVFENESFYILYNMGSTYTQASLISFKTLYEQKDNKTVDIGNEIKIYGETFNEKLGGKRFDKNLILLMMKKFDEMPIRKNKKSVINNPKVFEKMRASVNKHKEVLSANKEAYITMIGIEGGDDMAIKVTREEFNEVNKDLINQVYDPIKNLLSKNNLTLNNITYIELIGGSIRIPAIQEELMKNMPDFPNILGTHLNGDDYMAFGAAYMAANSSKNFLGSRKTYMVNGANEIFRIYLSNLINETEKYKFCEFSEEEKDDYLIHKDCIRKIEKSKELFPLRYRYNSRRTVSIEHDSNLKIKLTEEFPDKFEERDLMQFEITGVKEALEKLEKDNITSVPKIQMKFGYSKGGEISLESFIKYKVPVYYNENFTYGRVKTNKLNETIINNINDILNKSIVVTEYEMKSLVKEAKKNETKNGKNDKKPNFNETDSNINSTDNNSTNGNTTNNNTLNKLEEPTPTNFTLNNTLYITTDYEKVLKKMKKIGNKKDKEITIDLTVKQEFLLSPKPMNETQIRKSKKKIEKLIEVDTNRTKLLESRNNLETLIYKYKEWLESEGSKKFVKPEEYENTTLFIQNKSTWYEDEGFASSLETLNVVGNEINKHFKEYRKRQESEYELYKSVQKFVKDVEQIQKRVTSILTDKPWVRDFFNNTFMLEFNQTLKWFNETMDKVEKIPAWEKQIVKPYNFTRKIDSLRSLIYNMTKIKRPEDKTKKSKKNKKSNDTTIDDIDLDEILNKNRNDDFIEDLIKKNNITKEEFEQKLRDSIINDKKNKTESKKESAKEETKTDL